MSLFFCDTTSGVRCTWTDMLQRLMQRTVYTPLCAHSDYLSIIEHIMLSLLCSQPLVLLDHDMSVEEREATLGAIPEALQEHHITIGPFSTVEDLQQALLHPGASWSITLFTSGTTGRPKQVRHSFASITRAVRRGEKHKQDVWGLAYNPTHMAGIQVIMQALVNTNSLVRLFGLDAVTVFEEIHAHSITNISATPTFYRLLLGQKTVCPQLLRLTSGGEAFDARTIERLQELFPKAKITNVYASTEFGALFAAEGRDFVIKGDLQNLVRVESQELLVHRSLLGESMKIDGDWYHTGDLVEVINPEPLCIRFISRKSDMINVGGYKVNPSEVEEAIRAHSLVRDVRVFAKSNSVVGHIVCAEVVRVNDTLEESELRSFLQVKLQEFKLPRLIKFVEKIDTTRTGKLKRI